MSEYSPQYPKLKGFIEYSWNDGVISFFKTPGISINIKDKDRFIYSVCKFLTGSYHINQIINAISKCYPEKVKYVGDLIVKLNGEYL